jgi:hypothetical protein
MKVTGLTAVATEQPVQDKVEVLVATLVDLWQAHSWSSKY